MVLLMVEAAKPVETGKWQVKVRAATAKQIVIFIGTKPGGLKH